MRRGAVVLAVLALVGVASGCSLREVQLWFAINRKQAISREQAKSLADLVNSKRATGGCDGNYVGSCVPDNATQVHCMATDGPGPAVRGPLTVVGWDSFELDPDGDKNACVDPVGSTDYLGQELDGIAVRGWTFDPNTKDPISVDVYDGDSGQRFAADESRADLDGVFGGVGTNHGFDLVAGADVGDTRRVCVFGINTGAGSNTLLRCKTITMADYGEYSLSFGGGTVYGMIEAADQVPGGIHVRGFVVNDTGTLVGQYLTSPDGREGPGAPLTVVRDDVASYFGAPTGVAYGFDFVMPPTVTPQSGSGNPYAGGVCLRAGSTFPGNQLMCRPLDS